MLQLVPSRRGSRKSVRKDRKKRPPNAIAVAVREFALELGLEFETLSDADRGAVFEKFAAFHILRRFHEQELEPARLAGLLNEGADDIDCIALMLEGRIIRSAEEIDTLLDEAQGRLAVSFAAIKASRANRFDATKCNAFFARVAGFFQGVEAADGGELESECALAAHLRHSAERNKVELNVSVFCYYAALGSWGENGEERTVRDKGRERVMASADWIGEVDVEMVDKHRILDFMATGMPLRSIPDAASVRLEMEDYEAVLPLDGLIELPRIKGVEAGYAGHVPIDAFLRLLERDDGQGMREAIFNQNVRGYQGDGGVNERIRDTLAGKQRAQFLLRNNGVTVVADTMERDRGGVRISNFQIVNGLQTSNVIYRIRDQLRGASDVHVPVKLVATQEAPLRRAIVDATNRQTPITGAALFASCEKALDIEEYFLSRIRAGGPSLVLERRPGQYARDLPAEKITLEELLRAFYAVFLEQPQKSERGFSAIAGEVDDSLLAPSLTAEPYYAAARLVAFVREIARTRDEARLAQLEYHAALGLRILCAPGSPPLGDAGEMRALCRRIETQLNTEGRRQQLEALLWDITQSPRDRMRSRVQGVPQMKRTRDDIVRKSMAEVERQDHPERELEEL